MSAQKRLITGIVVSDKMQKSIVVKVESFKIHPIYHKRIRQSKRFVAHDEKSEAKMGDRVEITEGRPLSKTKRFVLNRVIEKNAVEVLA